MTRSQTQTHPQSGWAGEEGQGDGMGKGSEGTGFDPSESLSGEGGTLVLFLSS